MFSGLFYINKDKNVLLMGPDMTFIHVFFGLLIFFPSFGYLAICCWRISIQTLSLIFMHNEKWFTMITLGKVDRDKFYTKYIQQSPFDDANRHPIKEPEEKK